MFASESLPLIINSSPPDMVRITIYFVYSPNELQYSVQADTM